MRQREDLGGVGEGHGALTGRVEGAEDVDEEGDETEMDVAGAGDQGAKTSGEERPGHLKSGC